nr:EAL domain-containing response regulator [Gammaproteobacteria bacterium]
MKTPLNVLVVEHDQNVARLLARVIIEAGFRPTLVLSSDELRDTSRAFEADVIILDLCFPESSADALRLLGQPSNTPVVIITPTDGSELETAQLDLTSAGWNVVAKFAKPFCVTEVQSALRNLAAARAQTPTGLHLRAALDADEIGPRFQPMVCLANHQLVGFEALAYWDRPGHGTVSPDEFIPVTEAAGLMRELTDTMIAKSLEAAVRFERVAGPRQMSVNVSPSVLEDATFPARVASLL